MGLTHHNPLKLLIVLFFFTLSPARERGINISLIASAHPSIFRPVRCVDIRNITSTTIKGRLHFRVIGIRDGHLLKFRTGVLRIKPGYRRIYLHDIIPRGVTYYAPKLEDYLKKTHLLPEGYITVCCKFIDLRGEEYGRDCLDFYNFPPEPPRIIYPSNGLIISERKPLFLWTPVLVRPGVSAYYNVKVWERKPEDPEKRLLWERRNIHRVWIGYPLDAPPLKPDGRYYVKVEALIKGYLIAESRLTPFVFRPSWQVSDSVRDRFNAGVEQVIMPKDTIWSIKTPLIPCATFKNFGTDNIAFKSICEVLKSSGEVIYQSSEWIGNLEPWASREVSFVKWTPSDTGQYLIRFGSRLPNDCDSTNDFLTIPLHIIEK